MEKAKLTKIGNIFLNVLLCVFLAVCVFVVLLTVFSKRAPDGAAEIFGYQLRIVTTDSMAECEHTNVSSYDIKDIPARSMVFVKVMPEDKQEADEWYRSLRVGDVLTFRYVYTTQVTITHRIASITEKETGGFVIELEGDNKTSEDGQLYQTIDTSISNNTNYVIGKVTGSSYLLGVIMSFLMQPIGIVFAIIVPCLVIILLEVIKISRTVASEKKRRLQEEMDKKEDELDTLRQRLAELEAQKNSQADQGIDSKEDSE